MSKVKILIPLVMSSATKGEREFIIEGNTVKDIITNLSEKFGNDFKNKILDKNGNPKPVINIYINDENIKFLNELSTELNDNDEILFLPAVSGGWFNEFIR